MNLYKNLTPLLFKLDAERAHNLGIKSLKSGLLPTSTIVKDPALESTVCGLKFANPVGMAAGFDKNAEVIAPLFKLGFGFVEVGTVTPKPQHGNPKPRVFRDPANEAVINRMGFPNGGMNQFKDNVTKYLGSKPHHRGVLGLNIGMNKSQKDPAKDYSVLIKNLGPMADYLTINISSPNTPGLRDLQRREPLLELLGAVKEERTKACGDHLPPPVFVKLAPDLDDAQCEELAGALIEAHKDGGLDGIILTNTTLDRPEFLPETFRTQKGGLSGQPLTEKSTDIIRKFYRLTDKKLPIIGIGGVQTSAQAYAKIKAGASLVQLYTGFIYQGPCVANMINEELLTLLKADGYANITEAIGTE